MSETIPARETDAGFSLVELAVYIVVLGVILGVVTAVMLTLFQSEKTVSGVTNSTSDSQNMVSVLSGDIRNARQFQSNSAGTVLAASVAGRDSANLKWQCVRWTVTGSGTNRTVSRQTKADDAASSWGSGAPLLSAVRANGTNKFFVGSASAGTAATLAYALEVATTDKGVIVVSGQLSNTKQGAAAASSCF